MHRSHATVTAVIIFIVLCLVTAASIHEPSSSVVPQPVEQKGEQLAEQPIDQQPDLSAQPSRDTEFCLGGCPIGMPRSDVVVIHHILELSNNPTTKFADWVAYMITADTLGRGCKRTWEADPSLKPNTTLRPQDYRGARAVLASDRGHQAPLASLCGSRYWQEADYLSNITPQKSALNEGPWERLEDHERRLVSERFIATVYSITGPLYERDMPTLPGAFDQHRIPSGYWKIITIRKDEGIETAAFVMDQNSGREDDYCEKEISIDEIEQRTHLRFFPNIAENIKAALRRKKGGSIELINALGCE